MLTPELSVTIKIEENLNISYSAVGKETLHKAASIIRFAIIITN